MSGAVYFVMLDALVSVFGINRLVVTINTPFMALAPYIPVVIGISTGVIGYLNANHHRYIMYRGHGPVGGDAYQRVKRQPVAGAGDIFCPCRHSQCHT